MEFEKVKEIIVDSLSCDEDAVTLEANLKEDLDADSLDAVELIMAVEEEFDIEIMKILPQQQPQVYYELQNQLCFEL